MLTGYYSIASGMLAQQRKLEIQGNNLVNAQTPGYHAQRAITTSFEEELAKRLEPRATGAIGSVNPITIVERKDTLFQSGDVKQTDRNMDVAINGYGYFNIQGEDENRTYLTRNGQFDIDEQGYLILPQTGRVLGTNNTPIQVGDTNFEVKEDGSVYTSAGALAGNLLVTELPETAEQYENGLFGIPAGAQAQPVQGTGFVQGSLELSNVDLNREYTMMIEMQRGFQACSTALQLIDQIDQKAASQIANI